jgi:outer membrane protein assembly factor BamB
VALVAVVAVVAAAAFVVARSGKDEPEPGRAGRGADEGWTSEPARNSQLLAVGGGMVCSTTVRSVVYCLDAATGDERFAVQMEEAGAVFSSPIVLDDRVLVTGSNGLDGRLVAFSFEGEELWSAPAKAMPARELPVVDGVVALVEGDELVGIDVSTGQERWRAYGSDGFETLHAAGDDVYTDGAQFYAAIEVNDVLAGELFGHVVAIDPASGGERWRSPVLGDIDWSGGPEAAAPFDDDSAVAFLMDGISGSPRRMVVLDAATGQLRWEVRIVDDYASIVHLDGSTIVADGTDMRAYDRDGERSWSVRSPVLARSPDLLSPGILTVEEGRLFVAGHDVYEVDPATGASDQIGEDGVDAKDVAISADRLLIAGLMELEAIPLSSVGD